MGQLSTRVFPLIKFPLECLPFSGPFHNELRRLRASCTREQGYFLVRDTFFEDHGAVPFTLSDSPRLKFSLAGDWLLGRIHAVGLSYHISIFAWDQVAKTPNDYCYVKTAYGARSIKDTLNDLHTRGSREIFDNENMFTWGFKMGKGLFAAMEGKVNAPDSVAKTT